MADAQAPPKSSLTQEDFDQYLKNPIVFPEAFKDWISDWYAQNVPKLHVSQIFGFKLQSINIADDVAPVETIGSTAYGDLATVGPTLPNLANGFYVVMWGGMFGTTLNTDTAYMSISADGDTPSGQREMLVSGSEIISTSVGRLALVDFSSGDNNHTLAAKYKGNPTTSNVGFRWLHALKVTTDG